MQQIEMMETRVLFSTTTAGAFAGPASVNLTVTGQLDIVGTAHADVISVTQKGKVLLVKVDNFVKMLDAAAVKTIDIQAGAGNDQVISTSALDTKVFGGDGNDSVTTGAGNDTVDGGQGNDTINSGAGNDDDTGDAGNDSINGGTGDDSVYGGDGDDTLQVSVAVHGAFLFGGNGDDLLIGVDTRLDHADGGSGRDVARGMVQKLVTGIESLK